jgi:hypothetical protein
MKEADVRALVLHRLEQADTALADAQFLLDGGRRPQSIINRAYNARIGDGHEIMSFLSLGAHLCIRHGPALEFAPHLWRKYTA